MGNDEATYWMSDVREITTALIDNQNNQNPYFRSEAAELVKLVLWLRSLDFEELGPDFQKALEGHTLPPPLDGSYDLEQLWRDVREIDPHLYEAVYSEFKRHQ